MSVVEDTAKTIGDVVTGGALSARDAAEEAKKQQKKMKKELEQQAEEQAAARRANLRSGLKGADAPSLFDVLGGPQ